MMWSGITNFLFGSEKPEADGNDSEIPSLLLLPAEEEGWVLVEECDKLAGESPSVTSEAIKSSENAASAVGGDGSLAARPGVRLTSVHLGQKPPPLPASRPLPVCPRDVRARMGKRMTRKALEHSNKVYHYQSKCKKQRRYNYLLSYSNKNENKC